jgi:serine/threonine-protein kinase
LDAEPPASALSTPRYSTSERTTVLPAGDRSGSPERTSVLEVPPDLAMPRSRPYQPSEAYDDDPAGAGGQPRRSRRGLVTTAVLMVLVLAVCLVTWLLSGALYTTTPSVLGLTRTAAAQKLDRAGLSADFTQAFSETVAAGQVIMTDPGPGARTRKDDPVKVVLSKGPERLAVPAVVGKMLEQARKVLTGAGLAPGTTSEEFSDSVPQGSVISADPAPGTSLARGTPVSLVVSKGPAPLPVPQVVGLPVDQAQAQLTARGFVVQIATDQVFSDTVEAGSVAAQDPSDRAGQGAVVTLTLSKGPQLFPVPDVRGKTRARATEILRAAGFQVRAVQLNPFGTPRVQQQTPGGGEQKPKGTRITIVLV